jgi:hypothetical protein
LLDWLAGGWLAGRLAGWMALFVRIAVLLSISSRAIVIVSPGLYKRGLRWFAGWLACLAGSLARWLAGWLAAWLAGCRLGLLVCWLAGFLALAFSLQCHSSGYFLAENTLIFERCGFAAWKWQKIGGIETKHNT